MRTRLTVLLPLISGHLHASVTASLPQPDAPSPHWPWWLRILAVIAALAFVQIVARTMRKGAGRSTGSGEGRN